MPPIMFAQLQAADPIHIRDFLIILGFLLSAGTSLAALLSSRKSQKREVSFADEFVRKSECTLHHGSDGNRIAKLESDAIDLRREIKVDHDKFQQHLLDEIGKVQKRVDQLLVAVYELRGAQNIQDRS
jgi:hypothetical protein